MKRMNLRSLALLAVMSVVLSGCVGPIGPDIDIDQNDVTEPVDYSLVGVANAVPEISDDPYPLFVGARWIYRNAASDWNQQIGAAGLVENAIVAEVQGNNEVCYVLHTRYSNGPDEYIYLHRTDERVTVEGSRTVSSVGAQSDLSFHPSLTYLEFPLYDGKMWTLGFSEGTVEVEVLHQEVVAIENGITSLLETQPAIFTGVWRVHYHLFGEAPAFFGGPVQFLWFAPGVGVVKHVLNSVNYELVEYREAGEVLALNEEDDDATKRLPVGGIVTVQLRGSSPELAISGGWRLEEVDEGLDLLTSDFYADLVSYEDGAGTYVFTFRAVKAGKANIEFTRFNQDDGTTEGDVELHIVAE